jgi:hypothetical protein
MSSRSIPPILTPYTSEQFFSYSPSCLTPAQELDWVVAIADAFPGEDAIPNELILCARHICTHIKEMQEPHAVYVAGISNSYGMCYNFVRTLNLPYVSALEKLLETCVGAGIIPFNSPYTPYTWEAREFKIWHNPMRVAFTEFLAMQPLDFEEDVIS